MTALLKEKAPYKMDTRRCPRCLQNAVRICQRHTDIEEFSDFKSFEKSRGLSFSASTFKELIEKSHSIPIQIQIDTGHGGTIAESMTPSDNFNSSICRTAIRVSAKPERIVEELLLSWGPLRGACIMNCISIDEVRTWFRALPFEDQIKVLSGNPKTKDGPVQVEACGSNLWIIWIVDPLKQVSNKGANYQGERLMFSGEMPSKEHSWNFNNTWKSSTPMFALEHYTNVNKFSWSDTKRIRDRAHSHDKPIVYSEYVIVPGATWKIGPTLYFEATDDDVKCKHGYVLHWTTRTELEDSKSSLHLFRANVGPFTECSRFALAGETIGQIGEGRWAQACRHTVPRKFWQVSADLQFKDKSEEPDREVGWIAVVDQKFDAYPPSSPTNDRVLTDPYYVRVSPTGKMWNGQTNFDDE